MLLSLIFLQENDRVEPESQPGPNQTIMSSTPGNGKKPKRARTLGPDEVPSAESRKAEAQAARAITSAAGRIADAAEVMINCMNDFRGNIASLANRNYREIQQSTGALKQLVSLLFLFLSRRNKIIASCFMLIK